MTARDPGPVSHPVSQLTLLGAAATLENAAAADHTVVPPPNARSKGASRNEEGNNLRRGVSDAVQPCSPFQRYRPPRRTVRSSHPLRGSGPRGGFDDDGSFSGLSTRQFDLSRCSPKSGADELKTPVYDSVDT